MLVETKWCLACGAERPLNDFHLHKKGGQGRQPKCKECTSSWHRAYNARNDIKAAKKPRVDEYNRKCRTENPEKMRTAYADWKKSHPSSAIGRNLRRALVRKPTENAATVKNVVAIWEAQKGLCALSGVTMTWGKGAYCPTSLSIDRIDSKKGYTKDNIRLLCYAVNAMKGVWGDEHVVEIARGIVAHHDAQSKQPTWNSFPAFTDESNHMVLQ